MTTLLGVGYSIWAVGHQHKKLPHQTCPQWVLVNMKSLGIWQPMSSKSQREVVGYQVDSAVGTTEQMQAA